MGDDFVPTPERGVWVRQRRRNVGFGIGYGAMAVAWLGLGITILTVSDVSAGNRIGAAAVVIVPALGVLRVAVGCFRAGVLVTDREVVVRGPWTTRRIALRDVDRFDAKLREELRGSNPTGGVVLICRDGRRVSVQIAAPNGHRIEYYDHHSILHPYLSMERPVRAPA